VSFSEGQLFEFGLFSVVDLFFNRVKSETQQGMVHFIGFDQISDDISRITDKTAPINFIPSEIAESIAA